MLYYIPHAAFPRVNLRLSFAAPAQKTGMAAQMAISFVAALGHGSLQSDS
jgi:hypothetical protein